MCKLQIQLSATIYNASVVRGDSSCKQRSSVAFEVHLARVYFHADPFVFGEVKT